MEAANQHTSETSVSRINVDPNLALLTGFTHTAGVEQHHQVATPETTIAGLGVVASPELRVVPQSDCEAEPEKCCGGSCGTPMPRQPITTETVDGHCESCGKTSQFPPDRDGKIEECPHCREFLDVGELGWEMTDFGEPLD